jgi:antibiotic biosynthesis monooxygenase (ABM) superfamily enzyme
MSSNVFEYSVDHQLEPTRTAQGLALIHRFLQAELRMSGCLGVEGPTLVQAGETAIYNTRTRWKDVESFVVWVDSPQRRVLQEESQREGYAFKSSTNWKGYSQWLRGAGGTHAPTWKVNLLVLMTLYPTVLLITVLQRGWPGHFASALLLGNVASVALTGWLFVPFASSIYKAWLSGNQPPRWQLASLGSIMAILLITWRIADQIKP